MHNSDILLKSVNSHFIGNQVNVNILSDIQRDKDKGYTIFRHN